MRLDAPSLHTEQIALKFAGSSLPPIDLSMICPICNLVFQCKKYQGAVSASQIRDFRGAMSGKTDKVLFITTGYFTRNAIHEASREGAPTIDLIDGEKLAEKLKKLNLGIKIDFIEKVNIDEKWFEGI